MMERRPVGATDVRLSVVGLGAAWLGHDLSDPSEVSRAGEALRAAHEVGVNWVDTSENYFNFGNEAVIGEALRGMPERLPGVFEGGTRGEARRRCDRLQAGAGSAGV
jgi:aryl-alcohol dehydrogenase-like predicted oxidoreductase